MTSVRATPINITSLAVFLLGSSSIRRTMGVSILISRQILSTFSRVGNTTSRPAPCRHVVQKTRTLCPFVTIGSSLLYPTTTAAMTRRRSGCTTRNSPPSVRLRSSAPTPQVTRPIALERDFIHYLVQGVWHQRDLPLGVMRIFTHVAPQPLPCIHRPDICSLQTIIRSLRPRLTLSQPRTHTCSRGQGDVQGDERPLTGYFL